ncbi:MAG: hypothetical protein U1E45_14055 [Geminicoccaceae bacterium]
MDEVRVVNVGTGREWHLYRDGERVGRVWREGAEWKALRDDGVTVSWRRFEFRETALMALQSSLSTTSGAGVLQRARRVGHPARPSRRHRGRVASTGAARLA